MKRATESGFALGDLMQISIHALVKRATFQSYGDKDGFWISIHALVKRATVFLRAIRRRIFLFQSTPS